jgi:hypothetical protein
MLRWTGNTLMSLGALLGGAVVVAAIGGVHLSGLSWLIAVGMAKLTVVASGGLMAGGAFCLRLDKREKERRALPSHSADSSRRG